jgi:hypothetical protein
VVYRDKKEAKNFLFELGEAVAVNVGAGVSTLQVTLSRDAFRAGDYVAERKVAPAYPALRRSRTMLTSVTRAFMSRWKRR